MGLPFIFLAYTEWYKNDSASFPIWSQKKKKIQKLDLLLFIPKSSNSVM